MVVVVVVVVLWWCGAALVVVWGFFHFLCCLCFTIIFYAALQLLNCSTAQRLAVCVSAWGSRLLGKWNSQPKALLLRPRRWLAWPTHTHTHTNTLN